MTPPPTGGESAAGWRPKLVALDIDGTVVDYDQVMPRNVREAVRLVVDSGTPVVLATGRSWHGTVGVFDQLGLPPGPSVTSNGSVLVRYPPQEIIRAHTLDPAPVIEAVTQFAPQALIAVEEVGVGYRLTQHFPGDDLTGQMTIESAEELSSRPVTRVILRDPDSSPEAFLKLAEHLGLHGVSYYVGYTAWMDIAPAGVSKAVGLTEICDAWSIDAAEVLAVGDGRNDIEMLTWAGRGVAMGQAPDEVKSAANAVTGSFVDGGLITELTRFFGVSPPGRPAGSG